MAVLGDYICLYDEEGRITGYFGVQIDITDRKITEKAIADSEERYNLALEGASIGLWDWDVISKNTYLSPLWKKILGYQADEIENSFDSWKRLRHPHDASMIQQAMDDYIQGKTNKFEVTCRLLMQ